MTGYALNGEAGSIIERRWHPAATVSQREACQMSSGAKRGASADAAPSPRDGFHFRSPLLSGIDISSWTFTLRS
jgi:hypothetical protein